MAEGAGVLVIRRVVWCSVLFALVLALVACSKGPDPSAAIIGEWRHDEGSGSSITYIFYRNKTFDVCTEFAEVLDPASKRMWDSGKYEFVSEQGKPALHMVYTDKASGLVSDLTAPYVFDESGHLIFQWPNTRDMQYTKVN